MNIPIKRFDKELPLPEYKTKDAAAFDLHARETVEIPAHSFGYIPLNVVIETPKEHFLLIAARSSTHKKGLMLANGIGIIDPDYSGDDDEILGAYYNVSNAPVRVEKGERVAQGMFIATKQFSWHEVDEMGNDTRGGFGSTGTH